MCEKETWGTAVHSFTRDLFIAELNPHAVVKPAQLEDMAPAAARTKIQNEQRGQRSQMNAGLKLCKLIWEYYMCGPPMMNAAVINMLEELGVEPDRIMLDDFGG